MADTRIIASDHQPKAAWKTPELRKLDIQLGTKAGTDHLGVDAEWEYAS